VEERTTAGGIRRIACIDGLRALAVLAAVAAHIGSYGIFDWFFVGHVIPLSRAKPTLQKSG
jgi:peptidoglycan/LPS O-acetylase OafA/YrhL